jgi:hypothetical protein
LRGSDLFELDFGEPLYALEEGLLLSGVEDDTDPAFACSTGSASTVDVCVDFFGGLEL